jgi:hypothetical protein
VPRAARAGYHARSRARPATCTAPQGPRP